MNLVLYNAIRDAVKSNISYDNDYQGGIAITGINNTTDAVMNIVEETLKGSIDSSISKETLEAVSAGVLKDEQLQQALQHYKALSDMLKSHGERYHLVWLDAYNKLNELKSMWSGRREVRKLNFDNNGRLYNQK